MVRARWTAELPQRPHLRGFAVAACTSGQPSVPGALPPASSPLPPCVARPGWQQRRAWRAGTGRPGSPPPPGPAPPPAAPWCRRSCCGGGAGWGGGGRRGRRRGEGVHERQRACMASCPHSSGSESQAAQVAAAAASSRLAGSPQPPNLHVNVVGQPQHAHALVFGGLQAGGGARRRRRHRQGGDTACTEPA